MSDDIQPGDEVEVVARGTVRRGVLNSLSVRVGTSFVYLKDCESVKKIEILEDNGVYLAADGTVYQWDAEARQFSGFGISRYDRSVPERPLRKMEVSPGIFRPAAIT